MEPLPTGEDVARAYFDGRAEGKKSERTRIRRELLRRLEPTLGEPYIRGLLDEICPEEE